MNSDGQYKQVVAVVLAVLGLAVIFSFFNILNTGVTNTIDQRACEQQVRSHALGLQLTGRQFTQKITCNTATKTVTNDVKQTIAQSMKTCWDTFLQGRYNLFKGEYTYCHPCAVITVKKDVKNFGEYLATTTVPTSNYTYLEYLGGYATPGAKHVNSLQKKIQAQKGSDTFMQTSLEANERYAVMFTYAKGKNEITTLLEHVKGETAAGKTSHVLAIGSATVTGVATFLAISSGWGVTVGITTGVLTELVSYYASPSTSPEWVSMIVLDEYSSKTLKKYNCEQAPIGGTRG